MSFDAKKGMGLSQLHNYKKLGKPAVSRRLPNANIFKSPCLWPGFVLPREYVMLLTVSYIKNNGFCLEYRNSELLNWGISLCSIIILFISRSNDEKSEHTFHSVTVFLSVTCVIYIIDFQSNMWVSKNPIALFCWKYHNSNTFIIPIIRPYSTVSIYIHVIHVGQNKVQYQGKILKY